MANGWGGGRPGAGRKPKGNAEKEATGARRRRRGSASAHLPARVLSHPSVPAASQLPAVDEADAPDDLDIEERRIWLKLAPRAMVNGTLTPATMEAFSELCRTTLLVRELGLAPLQRGTPNHKGWVQLLDKLRLEFLLAPCGKPMPDAALAEQAKPANPLDRFLKKGRGA